MTASAITQEGERDRLVVKLGQIDWTFCLFIAGIAAAGALVLYSIAGGSW